VAGDEWREREESRKQKAESRRQKEERERFLQRATRAASGTDEMHRARSARGGGGSADPSKLGVNE
jgi:hypothetical protein